MATGKAVRADDASGLNIATVSFTEDAVTKHAQQIVMVDATTPTQKATVDSSGNVAVKGAANSGVDIGDVTINNGAGASAVNIQDGGNSITVDGTVTANLAAGTNNIGDVDVLTLPAIPAGTNNIGDVDVVTQVGAANFATSQVSVGITATSLVSSRATRRAITIVNHGTTDVYVGSGSVTTSNGLLLKGSAGAAVTLLLTSALSAIVGSGTQTVSVIEEYD